MSQSDNSSSLKEYDIMLHKVPLVSIGAEDEVLVKRSARVHEMERHASKEGTRFSMGQCWFQNGRFLWRENLVGIRHKYRAHAEKFTM